MIVGYDEQREEISQTQLFTPLSTVGFSVTTFGLLSSDFGAHAERTPLAQLSGTSESPLCPTREHDG